MSYFRKKGLVESNLFPWIIGVLVIVIVFVSYMLLKGRMDSALDFLKNLFRFGK